MDEGQAKAMSSYVEALTSTAAAGKAVSPADFAACVSACQRRVFQIAVSVLGNPADAEEVAQEAFLCAHRRFASLRDPAKFQAWVSRIAFRLALNHQRARRRRLARDTGWSRTFGTTRPEAEADRSAGRVLLDRVCAEIERLPEKLRVVLLLSAVEGMDAAEVATVLEIPVGTVRSRLYHARKRLLEALGQ